MSDVSKICAADKKGARNAIRRVSLPPGKGHVDKFARVVNRRNFKMRQGGKFLDRQFLLASHGVILAHDCDEFIPQQRPARKSFALFGQIADRQI
jgi:hypothetical protein